MRGRGSSRDSSANCPKLGTINGSPFIVFADVTSAKGVCRDSCMMQLRSDNCLARCLFVGAKTNWKVEPSPRAGH
jgi:hypothetical protein